MKKKQKRIHCGEDWFCVSTRERLGLNAYIGKYEWVHLKDLNLEEWLNSRGGRDIGDVMQDGKGKFVETYYPKNEVQKAYLPTQYQSV